MLIFRFKLTLDQKNKLEARLKMSQELGKMSQVKQILAILAMSEAIEIEKVATTLKMSVETVRKYVKEFLLRGQNSLQRKKQSGRPAKLTKAQKKELSQIIEKGPESAGFAGACWRSPMIAELISEKYNISYSVFYIAELLKNMGFSYQKAKFVSDHKDEEKPQAWKAEKWPQILDLARLKNAYILFGDEASFPQWGSLSYTWGIRGKQPIVKTSGNRRSYRVFGLIDYFTGKFFSQSTTERFNSETYQHFLTCVLSRTRKHIILIQDGAKYHTSNSTKEFFAAHSHRLTVFDLPSYSPDFNPIEGLWKNLKQSHIHLHYFPTFDCLVSKVKEALLDFSNAPSDVLALFGFYTHLNFHLSQAA